MSLNHRYEFVLLFDVKDGNPNGDPDAGNLPRVDAETGQGLVTDVCLKRKIRNYVGLTRNEHLPYEIYVKEKAILNKTHERAYEGIGKSEALNSDKKRKGGDAVDEARQWMCRNFYDVRTFGAVMSTGVNCGQVRGPVQLTFSRSIEPIVALEHAITRCAVATEKEALAQDGDNRTMGRKNTVPYGLYRCHGYISAHLARQTGFSDDDLALLWEALLNMFEHDRSAARGEMNACALYVFQHDCALGNAPARKLFDCLHITRTSDGPARSYADYQVTLDDAALPAGVTLHRLLE
ncbi:type I-C CRISPR-associated protein Cas7/Csd2 [Dickeya solani]|uniref:Type I-C CRISPR-associated protein Cas7/Csd2 n=1 Tax=Dickeya solani TaxID=1089444 RepID=A0AAX4EXS2_9GAMM|nr:type I-C CRISPR-associated protein Cas7/Csd2 [Dickeya solani]WOA52234.1 type I-C CRISPR-associated protein Cas7/Csd2 [Dickeya solani]